MLAHRLKQSRTTTDDMIDRDKPRTAGDGNDVLQQRLAMLDRGAAQIMAVEVEKVEGEIGEPLGPALAQRLVQRVDMGDAALVGHDDLAVEHQPGGNQFVKRCAKQLVRS